MLRPFMWKKSRGARLRDTRFLPDTCVYPDPTEQAVTKFWGDPPQVYKGGNHCAHSLMVQTLKHPQALTSGHLGRWHELELEPGATPAPGDGLSQCTWPSGMRGRSTSAPAAPRPFQDQQQNTLARPQETEN